MPAVAQALPRQTERALAAGCSRATGPRGELAVLRGRLREADQLRRHHGRPLPLEIRHDDFTVDVAENRILLAAMTRISTVPGVDAKSRRRLAALRVRWPTSPRRWRAPRCRAGSRRRLNDRYHIALRLAEIVWRRPSPEHAVGTTATAASSSTCPVVFESSSAPRSPSSLPALRRAGAAVPSDLDVAVRSRWPDLVWTRRGTRSPCRREVQAGEPSGYRRPTSTRCSPTARRSRAPRTSRLRGGHADPARHVVRHASIEILATPSTWTRSRSTFSRRWRGRMIRCPSRTA